MEILIIEDEKENAILQEKICQHAGYNTTIAKNGAEALEAISKKTFDIFLVDILLPDINGIDLAAKILAINPHFKLVFTTAFITEENRKIIRDMNCGLLIKPYTPKQLLETLNKLKAA